jgi:putative addiction module component (TIGR02574 family)
MPASLDAVTRAALDLTPEDRLALARKLLESVDLDTALVADAAWEAEISRRLKRFRAGEIETVPADVVFQRLRQIAPDR